MCEEHKFGGLWEDPERLERYEKLFAEAFPGQTALDILHRTSPQDAVAIFRETARGMGKLRLHSHEAYEKELEERVN